MTDTAVIVACATVALVTGAGLIGWMAWLTRAREDIDKADSAVPGSTEERLAWEMARRWWE
jgi:hypothetical protein